jgi:hypothetical protein
MRFRIVTVILLSLLAAAWPRAQARAQPSFRHENTIENLEALMRTVLQQIHVPESLAEGGALFQSLVPDESRAKVALRPGLPAAVIEKINEFHSMGRQSKEWLRNIAGPNQTVARVRGATTEQIRAYTEGSIAYEHFPGGAKTMAEQVLRPGVTFYEVDFLEPGKQLGMTYHLFYWDGQQWSMLGPLWRALR